ncbi:universal stress protein [Streptomyces sp. NBC_01465]|uniref:universal stress protein n=1 Tax=Streptomyces sp. NBC_01465 TaxID=2903878 RepID=UPI002E3533B8|nr:universal stress protein [Streptomyces sp. NBC_01465]
MVVGTDGSDASLRAVDWAVDAAARHHLKVRLVYGSLWERYEGPLLQYNAGRSFEQRLAEEIVAAAVEHAHRRNSNVEVTGEVQGQDAVGALVRASNSAWAVVTGSRGRGALAATLLGSVSLMLAARAHCPVVVVRTSPARGPGANRRIVLGVGEEAGTRAAAFAFREAAVRGCSLEAVRSWRCPAYEAADVPVLVETPAHAHEQLAAELIEQTVQRASKDEPSVVVERSTVEGAAHKVLLDRAAAADLVVVGVTRRSHRPGRVAHALLHHADCPVAVVP